MVNGVRVFVCAAVNHSVDEELVERVFAQNRAFFALPAEQKQRILADGNNRRARHARARFLGLVPVPCVETEEQQQPPCACQPQYFPYAIFIP